MTFRLLAPRSLDAAYGLPRLGSRRQWLRLERSVIHDHMDAVAAELRALVGLPVLVASAHRDGLVTVTVPGWCVVMAGVSPPAAQRLVSLSRATQVRLDRAGRYGRFWWVSVRARVDGATPAPAVMLGSHLRLVHTGPGPDGNGAADHNVGGSGGRRPSRETDLATQRATLSPAAWRSRA